MLVKGGTGNAWGRTQPCGYRCRGANAPGHVYTRCWLYIDVLVQFRTKKCYIYSEYYNLEIYFENKYPDVYV